MTDFCLITAKQSKEIMLFLLILLLYKIFAAAICSSVSLKCSRSVFMFKLGRFETRVIDLFVLCYF